VAWLSAEEFSTVHEIAGPVAGLVAFRLVWTWSAAVARVSPSSKGTGTTLSYLGDMARGKEQLYLGHDSTGAAMTVALLVAFSGTSLTGWLLKKPGRVAILPDLPQIVASVG
jgi:cytochrome b